jgi:hypothetical protein
MAVGTKVTNLGLANVTAALLAYASVAKYIQWGTGTTTPAVTDTALAAAGSHETRTSGTPSQQQTTVANDTLRVVGTITCVTGAKAITEAGLFDGAGTGGPPPTGAVMFLRTVFDVINVAVSDGIAFTFNIAFSDNS